MLATMHRLFYRSIASYRLKREGVDVGHALKLTGMAPVISNRGQIILGNAVHLRSVAQPVRLETAPTGRISMGNGVLVNNGAHIWSAASVMIGEGSLIGDQCSISDSDFHSVHEGRAAKVAPIHIGKNVWIGRSAIILPGVTIGDHSVVAAGSVVSKTIPPRQLWGGNPAAFLRHVEASEEFRRT